MATQVQMPQKEDKLSKLLTVGGAIAGGIGGSAGGPMGAVQGAGAGASLGGVVGGLAQSGQGQPSAVERRMGIQAPQAAPAEDPTKALQEAQLALQSQPQDVQQQYAPMIQAAMLRLRRGTA